MSAADGGLFMRWNAGALAAALVTLGAGGVVILSTGEARVVEQPEVDVQEPEPFDPTGFAADTTWDDGRAEVARYQAVRTLYGKQRPYELVRIAVKEPFDPLAAVKPDDDRPGSVEALKTIAVHQTDTGRLYQYRQQVVVRVRRGDPRALLDASMSSQEWCGNTFVRLRRDDQGSLLRTVHSYWDGEGDRTDQLPSGVWLEDQLPFALRGFDWETQEPFTVSLLPTVLNNKAPATKPVQVTIRMSGREKVGAYDCWHVTVEGARTGHYWIGREGVRPLVKFEDATGSALLTSLERVAYWQDPAAE